MPCMPIFVTSDAGQIGPFSWINTYEALHRPLTFWRGAEARTLRLQLWGCFGWGSGLRGQTVVRIR